ncbi:hypothetical protein BV898_01205 [Hypsibius exemplaris]|uniref:Uncharacterized protein n=1 Tax=Hypsibius exemplaris TaxID=2072580 RepID=A0A1W0XBW2_HYPEX|nr:hypothetical protein BV898_01205 [Hypsibius exemplaris]
MEHLALCLHVSVVLRLGLGFTRELGERNDMEHGITGVTESNDGLNFRRAQSGFEEVPHELAAKFVGISRSCSHQDEYDQKLHCRIEKGWKCS